MVVDLAELRGDHRRDEAGDVVRDGEHGEGAVAAAVLAVEQQAGQRGAGGAHDRQVHQDHADDREHAALLKGEGRQGEQTAGHALGDVADDHGLAGAEDAVGQPGSDDGEHRVDRADGGDQLRGLALGEAQALGPRLVQIVDEHGAIGTPADRVEEVARRQGRDAHRVAEERTVGAQALQFLLLRRALAGPVPVARLGPVRAALAVLILRILRTLLRHSLPP